MSEFMEVNISVVDDVWIKQIYFAKFGDAMMTHAHMHDHQTLVAVGSVMVLVNGVRSVYHAPKIVLIRAGEHHQVIALEDRTVVYCIHALRDGESVVQGIPNDQLHTLK